MTDALWQRWVLAAAGALGGAALYGIFRLGEARLLPELAALPLLAACLTLFGGFLAMAGPVGLRLALRNAALLALVTGVLVLLAGLRYLVADDIFNTPFPALMALVVATLPMPFLIAQSGAGWRDYPTLFLEAWTIVVRYAAAWAFTGLVWLVIYLSDALLGIVGVRVIQTLIDVDLVPFLITGGVLGVAMAVLHEMSDLLSPYLVLRLFRLLLPVVLAVMVVFLVALPFRGLSGLFEGFSPALILLSMVAGGVALVSISVDQTDEDATTSPFLRAAAQVMALVLPVLAAIAAWAVWLRVAQYGWTPNRVFVALISALALAYGGIYALAVLRRAGWMARIRRDNLGMGLVLIAVAALWLTPVLNAERISARDQLARYEDGRTPVAMLDVYEIGRWGKAGAGVTAMLRERSKEPGQSALAAVFAGNAGQELAEPDLRQAKIEALRKLLPLQPPAATGMRDALLDALADFELDLWTSACQRTLSDGQPGCVLVIADLMPLRPGEEGMVVLRLDEKTAQINGIYLSGQQLMQSAVLQPNGLYPTPETALRWLGRLQAAMPPLMAAELNQLGAGAEGLMMFP